MRLIQTALLSGWLVLALPEFAHAATTTLPDPSGLTLFTLGVAGLILGRRAASRRNRDGDGDE